MQWENKVCSSHLGLPTNSSTHTQVSPSTAVTTSGSATTMSTSGIPAPALSVMSLQEFMDAIGEREIQYSEQSLQVVI